MHYPNQVKLEPFRIALRERLLNQDYNFCGVYFPAAIDFSSYKKTNEEKFCFVSRADFSYATFSGKANFSYTEFESVANFSRATFCAEAKFSDAKLKSDADFSHVTFSAKAKFGTAQFGANADFNSTTFGAYAYFGSATFSGRADFTLTKFIETASFDEATFDHNATVDFGFAKFGADAYFRSATFSADASFSSVTFGGLTIFEPATVAKQWSFSNAQFKDYVKFKRGGKEMFGDEASLKFDSLRIEKPERLSFHSVKLRPHWFINTDPRKFEFIDVDWGNIAKELKSELASSQERLKQTSATSPHRLLSIAYRQLATNAEDNNDYVNATKFRYNSMELRRLEKWKGWNIFSLDFWYWALSGYGERVNRAAIALLLILFLACVPYWFTGFASSKQDQDKVGAPIRVVLAKDKIPAKQLLATLAYSLETASLQKPEPRPVTTAARFFVGLETILAPLQAALLALAIRRKYMR
jgi:hypothetical protein